MPGTAVVPRLCLALLHYLFISKKRRDAVLILKHNENKFLTLIAISTLSFAACKNDVSVIPIDGGNNEATYQPFTRDSKWAYRTEVEIPGTNQTEVENSVITMTQGLYQMDNKVYHLAKSVTGAETINVFYGLNDKVYSMRQTDEDTGIDLDIPYLKDDAAAGTNWIPR